MNFGVVIAVPAAGSFITGLGRSVIMGLGGFLTTRNVILVFMLFVVPAVLFIPYTRAGTARVESGPSFTPPPGSPLRGAVMNALRQEVKRLHGLEVVFVVTYLKVKDGWAWTHTMPESRDGANRYEDVSSLLNFRNGAWDVVEMPCGEEGNPDCLGAPGYFDGLMKRFPELPMEILPAQPENPGPDESVRSGQADPRITLTTDVVGCAESAQGRSVRSNDGRSESPPRICVSRNSVTYARAIRHQCCRTVAFRHGIKGSEIEIVEVWSGLGCRCRCFSSLSATLAHVPPGEYSVVVRKTGARPGGGNEPLPDRVLLFRTVKVPGAGVSH